MKSWKIPVTWEVCGTVEVEANTIEEAIYYARDDEGVLPLPDESDYVDGSWRVTEEDAEIVRSLYNDNQQDEVIMDVNSKFDDVIDNGRNIKMINMAGCGIDEDWTLDDCESKCPKYYGCYAVALANDVLKEYEDNCAQ